jgi:putative SOS response-associated peptidase YedK
MCGRYSLAIDRNALDDRFALRGGLQLPLAPRYNIAPTQDVLTVVNEGSGNEARMMKWGLIPPSAKDPSVGNRMINARAETVAEKPSFRQAYRKQRCLVIADGFYEWRKAPGSKAPMRIVVGGGEPFGFAGLWETWRSQEEEFIHSCTIITTTPNELMAPVHSRMPVILPAETEELWLDQDTDPAALQSLLVPYMGSMEAYKVSTLVNSPRNDTPDVMARVA